MISYILAIICGIFLLIADAVSKIYIISTLSLGERIPFIDGFLDIIYIRNQGAAWGIFSGKTAFLIVLTVFVMSFCIYFLIRYAKKSKLLFWAIIFVLSGGLGNMYDRIFREGKVIDFLHFEFWTEFPIFNIADCTVVIGAGLLILYFILDTVNDYKLKKQENNAENRNSL